MQVCFLTLRVSRTVLYDNRSVELTCSVCLTNLFLLSLHRDKSVFRQLERLLSPDTPFQQCCEVREDLRERLESRSSAGGYIAVLCDLAGFGIGGREVAETLLTAMGQGDGERAGEANNQNDLAQLLYLLSKHSPQVFRLT